MSRNKNIKGKLNYPYSLDSGEAKRKDDAVISLIRGLDLLVIEARKIQLGVAVNILHRAKEDLVYWAADLDFYESKQEKFINKHLFMKEV